MKRKRFWRSTAILVVLAIIIKIYSASPARVEAGYAVGFYPAMATFFRFIFGWLPFSFGDILFGAAGLWLLWKLIGGIKALIKKRVTIISFLDGLKKTIIILLIINVVFNFFWGINYNRQGIASQLNLKMDSVNYTDLTKVTTLLIEKMNASKKYLLTNNIIYPTNTVLFKKIEAAYDKTKQGFPFLQYRNVSIKSSMWGWLGNYTGFSGYYNPFTGEAQVNTTIPKFLQPYTTCHEVAHQLGYAKEEEANTVGYLAALNSGDSLLLYSTYFDLYSYTSRQLRFESFIRKDTLLIKELNKMILPEVKADMKEVIAFYNRHRNPIEPFVRKGYGFYLKNNNQPKGVLAYDDVTGFLIAYYKKFGKI
jgi:Protein of unknown function (DUF3810)